MCLVGRGGALLRVGWLVRFLFFLKTKPHRDEVYAQHFVAVRFFT
jgi:hypothetical protein